MESWNNGLRRNSVSFKEIISASITQSSSIPIFQHSNDLMDSNDMGRQWCSWCFRKSRHTVIQHNILRRNVCECQLCGRKTVKCRFCSNMARAGKTWDDECCAVHDGTIGTFESLRIRLKNITEWRLVTKRESANISAAGKIAGVAVLSGGALAVGMTGGGVVITVGAGLLGTVGGGVLVNKFAGEIDGFDIKTRHSGSGTQIIFINGLLSQDESLLQDWLPTLQGNFANNTWYELAWESKRLRDLGKVAFKGAQKTAFLKALSIAVKKETKQAAKKLSRAVWLPLILELAGNPWLVALAKAQKTGQLLADLIVRSDGRARYVLLGHSLGARVIYYTLQALAEADLKQPRIREVHLLGGAVGRDQKSWTGLDPAVSGSIFNYFSRRDDVLRVLYKVGTLFTSEPIGRGPIESYCGKIYNVDVTDYVGGHGEFKKNLPMYIRR